MNLPATIENIVEPDEAKKFRAPGWYKDISNEEYHRGPGKGSSNLKILLEQTGAHLEYARTHPTEATAAMNLGTAVHTLTLEPEKFDAEIAVRPEGLNLRTNAGKADMETFLCANVGKTIITPAQYEEAKQMAANVRAHPIAGILLQDIIVESSVYWWYRSMEEGDDHRYKEFLKVRPDALSRSHPVVMDLKTTKDGSYSGFIKSIQDRYYHLSAAMYMEGINQCQPLLDEMRMLAYLKFVFICVENFAPYQVSVYELSDEYMKIGKHLYRTAMYRLSKAREENWPGYPDEVRVIEPPSWATRGHIV